MKRSLFIFRRDLRLEDNTALLRAVKDSDEVFLAFIFPPEQIDPKRNSYFSHPAVQFMCESLRELADSAHIHFFKDDNITAISNIYKHLPFDALYQNEDYSVYAKSRDAKVEKWCKDHDVDYVTHEDYGLFPLKDGLLPDNRPYTVLAQFYKRYLKDLSVRQVNKIKMDTAKFVAKSVPGEMSKEDLGTLYQSNPHIAQKGGRSNALRILRRIKTFASYKETRDTPALVDGTTRMSAHLKFGTVSVREMYWACVRAFDTRDHPLIRELIFREFYLKIYALNPALQRGTAYHDSLDKHVPWSYDRSLQKAWQTGTTGYPLVDAGMRQLQRENWCHNRVRMLVASVATKYFLLDWRDCAKFFYTQLVDADTFSNTAGWGWASSTGVDATLYFRAPFNPFIQSKKFDKDGIYIKRYVPELADVSPADLHKWFDPKVRAKYPGVKYPAPVVDHKIASSRALTVYKQAAKHI